MSHTIEEGKKISKPALIFVFAGKRNSLSWEITDDISFETFDETESELISKEILTYTDTIGQAIQWVVFFQWSFSPNSAWRSIETTAIGKTHPTLI